MERRQEGREPTTWAWSAASPSPCPARRCLRNVRTLKADEGTRSSGTARLVDAATQRRPRFYDLETSDRIPYWKIGLLHLDSFASTVVQTCAYWKRRPVQVRGIALPDAGRTISRRP